MKAYAFNAAMYCEECGDAIIQHMKETNTLPERHLREDSNHYPQGPIPDGGGEADCPQHCDSCCAFLENPLTQDGDQSVRDAFARGDGDPAVLRQWREFYDYLVGDKREEVRKRWWGIEVNGKFTGRLYASRFEVQANLGPYCNIEHNGRVVVYGNPPDWQPWPATD